MLAGSIGTASARAAVDSVVTERPIAAQQVMEMVQETTELVAHNRSLREYSEELETKSSELEAATEDLRAANEKLRELDRVKDEFVSTVTHELRTPLTSIRAFSEILHDNPELELEKRERFLEIILSENQRLTRLIEQVLDVARLEAGGGDWVFEELVVDDVLHAAAGSMEQLFEERSARLELDLAAADVALRLDRDRLTQVVVNLLANALKYSDAEAPRIRVRSRATANGVSFDVVDNGPGIDLNDRELLFEKFRRLGDRVGEAQPGTGLGLSICRQIVHRFGGEIQVDNEPGWGARFTVRLPTARGASNEAAAGGR